MPEMLGEIGGVSVVMPPAELLGEFTTPGDCDGLAAWLEAQAQSADALIVSIDMLCYGGLIASREGGVTAAKAKARLHTLARIREKRPELPIYAFNAIMRTAPTATREAAPWRMDLASYLYYQDKAGVTGAKSYAETAKQHLSGVPKGELAKYRATRLRDHEVHLAVIGLLKQRLLDYVIFGQDDADEYGPHRAERIALSQALQDAGVAGLGMVCGGIDQTACTLLARALARGRGVTPRVRVEWASESGRHLVPPNEGQSVERATQDQIYGSGGRPARTPDEAVFVLYVNTQDRSEDEFTALKDRFSKAVEGGALVAIADLRLRSGGRADCALFRYLLESRLGGRLAAYAGWNTASNTLGTAIPQAIIYWLALQDPAADARQRELAHREFILQRFAAEYGYHNYIRPLAYDYVVNELHGSKEEVSGGDLELLEKYVSKQSRTMLESFFEMGFKGTTFPVGPNGRREAITGLTDVNIHLPWPRAYEVSITFGFTTTPVTEASSEGTGEAASSD
jgi:hypothetical protein